MGQNLKIIENAYDAVAIEYAQVFSDEHEKKPKDREMLQRFSRAMGSTGPLWELGCGPGHTANYLRNLGMEVSGLDISNRMLEQAKTAYPDIHFKKGNIIELEFRNESVGGIVAFYAIVHFTAEQVLTALGEVFRVLKPGGVFLFTYHIGKETIHIEEFLGKRIDIDFMLFSTDFIEKTLRERGFDKVETFERAPYPGVEYESRRAYVFATKPVANSKR